MFPPLTSAGTFVCYACRVVYDRGFVRGFSTMGTPVRPGVSRVFGRLSLGSKPADGKKPLIAELMTRLPHWVYMRNKLADQDTVVNVKQVSGDVLTGQHADSCVSMYIAHGPAHSIS